MAVAVATNVCRSRSNPSSAADRMPPWLPTKPPRKPEAAPALRASPPLKRMRFAHPSNSLTLVKRRRAPKTTASQRFPADRCNSAPASPPAALAIPKLHNTRGSGRAPISQNRNAVPIKWGTETAATATLVPTVRASTGVSRLPIPKPLTAAMAPAATATPNSNPSNHIAQSTGRFQRRRPRPTISTTVDERRLGWQAAPQSS